MLATSLYELGYGRRIVLAAILHDVLEDTDVTRDDLVRVFGGEITDLVFSVSFDSGISDRIEQTKELFYRVKSHGFESAVIKCGDLYCNLTFVTFVEDTATKDYLVFKYHYFLEEFQAILGSEKIFQMLRKRVKEVFDRAN